MTDKESLEFFNNLDRGGFDMVKHDYVSLYDLAEKSVREGSIPDDSDKYKEYFTDPSFVDGLKKQSPQEILNSVGEMDFSNEDKSAFISLFNKDGDYPYKLSYDGENFGVNKNVSNFEMEEGDGSPVFFRNNSDGTREEVRDENSISKNWIVNFLPESAKKRMYMKSNFGGSNQEKELNHVNSRVV